MLEDLIFLSNVSWSRDSSLAAVCLHCL